MKGKLILLAGAAVGYVLGTRAGRQRYEEIKGRADALWHDPKVQQKVSDAQEAVKARAPEIQEKLTDAAGRATDKVKSTVQRHDTDDVTEVGTHGRNGHYPQPG
ncbi:YtxH domain-containing protein [Jiangella mangrovi]|uniref:Oxygen-dependent protoporphyrinogen oxidase n=1 Tax=Jiangella mangrovi TaxID=1524084 RepID=A0A7W9GN85_9ACTN|nr:YtxH domain-containing protein [Jiangella mangrovi]MBB5786817.1 oxygen-dependent protoporphyrinogen oxidase [Jiangella mangrovi]